MSLYEENNYLNLLLLTRDLNQFDLNESLHAPNPVKPAIVIQLLLPFDI